jgi:hypothetical protein
MLVTAYKTTHQRNQHSNLYMDFDMLLCMSGNLLSRPKARAAIEDVERQSSDR